MVLSSQACGIDKMNSLRKIVINFSAPRKLRIIVHRHNCRLMLNLSRLSVVMMHHVAVCLTIFCFVENLGHVLVDIGVCIRWSHSHLMK